MNSLSLRSPSSLQHSTTPSPPSARLWRALEAIPAQCGVAAVWRPWLGAEFELFKSAFLQSLPDRPVRSYPCPRDCGCWHEVVVHDAATIVGVCRCESWRCDNLALTLADLVPLGLSWPRLARALVRAFELDAKSIKLGTDSTWQLGSWSADPVPVLLTIQTSAGGLRRVTAELVARLRRPFILLAPTSQFLDASHQELLANAGAAFFPLAANVIVSGQGILHAKKTPGALFAAFNPQTTETLDENAARQAFALVRKLDSDRPTQRPSALTVFRWYCLEELSAGQIARRCHCSRMTVLRRLKDIRTAVGADPRSLRRLSNQFSEMADGLADPRAPRLNRRRLIDDAGQEEEGD